MLLMLEDCSERIARFSAVLHAIQPKFKLRVWRNAWLMIRDLEQSLPKARLISLNHDLEPESESAEDPGTGWDLIRVLAEHPPCCPVIVHSSNRERSTWMMGELELGKWPHYRVPPLGEDWIETIWRHTVLRLLRRSRKQR